MKFNENIRNLRRERDYSQEYLAEKLNVTRQTISKWENGAAMPDLKKLTEIADFFSVSMDTLLGIEIENDDKEKESSSNNNENNYNTEYQKRYTEQLFSIAYQNQYEQNIANHKALKTIAIILSIAIVCVIFGLILLSNTLDSKINNLQGLINTLNAQSTAQQNYPDDDNYEFEYNFVSANSEKPYLIDTEFKYSPSKYPKNSSVYLSINKQDGSTQQIDFTEKNGVFNAAAQIDVTAVESGYVYIDDGETITKEEMLEAFNPGYFILFESNYIFDEFSDQGHKNPTDISFEIYENVPIQITEAYLVTERAGKVDHSEKLRIEKDADESAEKRFRITSNYEIPQNTYDVSTYFKLIDENKVEYRYYPDTDRSEIVFPDGKILK